MEHLHLLIAGFAEVFKWQDLIALCIGLLIGMAVSIMPGLGLVMGVVLALPFTFSMDLETSIILLTAIYMAGTYAGCFTTILYRIPGEPMDVPLLWDGWGMTQRGEAAKALGWALVAALTGGLLSSAVMVSMAGPLSSLALSFGAPEYFAAVFFGLTTVVALAGKSLPNALISLCIGLLVSTIGIDSTYGAERFTFGSNVLINGVPFVMVLVGMFGFGEILTKIGQGPNLKLSSSSVSTKTSFPTWSELWALRATFARSSVIGTLLGLVPGAGATISSFVSYGVEKQYGRRGSEIGTGIPEGIVAPQIASTASVAGHIVPLLTLGLPGSGATAVILAAFLLHGVQPGPFMLKDPASALTVYTILSSMFVSVIGMCLLGFLWIRLVVRVLTIPQGILVSIIVMFALVGAFADRNSISDVWTVVVFGSIAWTMERVKLPTAPMVLGAILGPIAEDSFTRSMITFHDDWTIFVKSPISATLMSLAIVSLVFPKLRPLLFRKTEARDHRVRDIAVSTSPNS
ncbi:tripartite tricarboxylate transporter permease [Bradyrhizobium sp. NP1]|uniref:tripartite tricarboxylate transporter permease n=1 Tax=Bradyrhizobium sp. NP1 TaxID=3049772 RepID=UPI0025A5259D|nr:tripartite tricarboxylate transporter permease [Bradyrhizobium sp. NP1]WJR75860.1 tripartite tricarboxylate transporter permease [Bradyrhizobium sp. NP1]